MFAKIARVLFMLMLMLCLGCLHGADTPTTVIAVLFPDSGAPYRAVFNSIIEGIEDRTRTKVVAIPIRADFAPVALQAALRRQDIKVVVALGRIGIRAAGGLERDVKTVAGGVVVLPEAELKNLTVSSMVPDPAALFARLKMLMPRARRVHVVYEPVQNAWLIRLAQRAAKAQALELVAHEAADIKTAMQIYQSVLAGMDPVVDTLWLPQDGTTVQESVVLPTVLRSAWSNNLIVFSSNVGHVKQGVLFALYPDNVGYGRALGAQAMSALSGADPGEAGMTTLREVSSALNTATLSHLRLPVSSKHLKEFNMTFPEQ